MPLPAQENTIFRHPKAGSGCDRDRSSCRAFTLPLLVACGEQDSTQTVGQRLDAAVAKTGQTATQATGISKGGS